MEPTKIAVQFKCTVCDLAWERHPENPTIEDCIRLLKSDALPRLYPTPYWQQPYYTMGGTLTVGDSATTWVNCTQEN